MQGNTETREAKANAFLQNLVPKGTDEELIDAFFENSYTDETKRACQVLYLNHGYKVVRNKITFQRMELKKGVKRIQFHGNSIQGIGIKHDEDLKFTYRKNFCLPDICPMRFISITHKLSNWEYIKYRFFYFRVRNEKGTSIEELTTKSGADRDMYPFVVPAYHVLNMRQRFFPTLFEIPKSVIGFEYANLATEGTEVIIPRFYRVGDFTGVFCQCISIISFLIVFAIGYIWYQN